MFVWTQIQSSFNQWLVWWGEWLRLGITSDTYCRVTSRTNLVGFIFLHHTHRLSAMNIVCLYSSKRIRIEDKRIEDKLHIIVDILYYHR